MEQCIEFNWFLGTLKCIYNCKSIAGSIYDFLPYTVPFPEKVTALYRRPALRSHVMEKERKQVVYFAVNMVSSDKRLGPNLKIAFSSSSCIAILNSFEQTLNPKKRHSLIQDLLIK